MREKKKKLIEYNKKEILNAARTLFKKNGLEKTTVDEIARAADYSKATIYVYFKNKDDIYNHIVLEYMIVLRDEIKCCLSDTDDYEKAYFLLCDSLVRFEKEYPMYFEFILGNISVEKKKMEELSVLKDIYDTGEEINVIVCEYLKRAKENGFADADIEPMLTTFVMWSSICGLISLSSNKNNYIENNLILKREDFLHDGFKMILRMITR